MYRVMSFLDLEVEDILLIQPEYGNGVSNKKGLTQGTILCIVADRKSHPSFESTLIVKAKSWTRRLEHWRLE